MDKTVQETPRASCVAPSDLLAERTVSDFQHLPLISLTLLPSWQVTSKPTHYLRFINVQRSYNNKRPRFCRTRS